MWWFIKSFLLFLLVFTGCKAPFDPAKAEVSTGREVSIQFFKSLYSNAPLRISEDYVIRGTVVSSDEQGNFRWTLVIQDETGGLELKVGLNPYYERFTIGEQVLVKCSGLVLGAYGRTIQLGAQSDNIGYETGFIPGERLGEHVVSAGRFNFIEPVRLVPADFSMRYVNCLVRVDAVAFVEEERGMTWGDSEAYTERHVIFSDHPGDTLAVRTAPTAVFAMDTLPTGQGSLEGILTQFAGSYALVLTRIQTF